MPRQFATIAQPVSVCHQWSITGTPSSSAPSRASPGRALAGEEERAEAAQSRSSPSAPLGILLPDRAERGRRREHRRDAVLRDDPPERAGVGRADRLAFVEDGRAAVEQRRVDDVRVADDPADVGRRPVDLAGLDVVDVAHRPRERDGVAAVVADDPLRLPGRPGRVEDVERIGRLDRDAVGWLGGRHAPRPSRCRGRRRAPPSCCGRCRTTQRSGFVSARSIAGRAAACTGRRDPARSRTTRSTTTFGFASSMRLASSCAANRRTRPSAPRRAARTRASRSPPRAPSACRRSPGRPSRPRGRRARRRNAATRRAARDT